jgi:hypothetical protein
MKYFTPVKISENISETPEGFLICIGVPIARTGEMIYGDGETPVEADKKGRVILTRDEKEVFRPETMASFEGKPLTIGHPSEFVGPDNWKHLAKGVIQNVRRGKDDMKDSLIADLLITDALAINLVKNGLREVSCGYEADYEQTGDGKGSQSNIIGNHLALVDEGRAGPDYAINDHKGKVRKMKLTAEKIKTIFQDAQATALKILDEASKEDDKDKAKDAAGSSGSQGVVVNGPAGDAHAFDEMKKMVDALGAKIDGMMKQKDAKEDEPKEKEEKTADDNESSMEDRMKALETAVAKLLENQSTEDDDMDGDDDDMTGDDDGDDDDMTGDDGDFDETTMTGDTKSRAEILAPGIKMTKDVKVKALQAAYATKDGKSAIEKFTSGKAPNFKDEKMVDTIFIGAAEVLKHKRVTDISRTKQQTKDFNQESSSGFMTAEKLNEINAKHWQGRGA